MNKTELIATPKFKYLIQRFGKDFGRVMLALNKATQEQLLSIKKGNCIDLGMFSISSYDVTVEEVEVLTHCRGCEEKYTHLGGYCSIYCRDVGELEVENEELRNAFSRVLQKKNQTITTLNQTIADYEDIINGDKRSRE